MVIHQFIPFIHAYIYVRIFDSVFIITLSPSFLVRLLVGNFALYIMDETNSNNIHINNSNSHSNVIAIVITIATIVEVYAFHSYCNTQSNNTYSSYYYKQECYNYIESLIKYTLNEQYKDWSYGYSQSITRITET